MSAPFAGWRETSRSPLVGIGPLPFWLLGALVLLSLLLGGGSRTGAGADVIIQLASLLVIAACLSRGLPRGDFHATLGLVVIAAALALPLLQLIPLPPWIWALLPGRSLMVEVYQRTNQPLPWLPVSLDADATSESASALLPAIAVFLATIHVAWPARRSIVLLVVAVGVVSVMLGLAQLMQGPDSPLRFYPITNPSESVGFFANRNHYAALLYCLMPFAVAWIVGLSQDRRPERSFGTLVGVLIYVLLVLGIAMARSRAGVILAALSTIGSLLLTRGMPGPPASRSLMTIGAAVALAVIIGFQFGFYGLTARFNDGVLDDFRVSMGSTTIAAIRDFLPLGSGFGTFVPVYQIFETPGVLLTTYVNHAHNDWLEIFLEGGWFALVIAGAFLVWFILAGGKVWANSGRARLDRALGRAATIAVAALLLHSATDYPLRTTALSVLFAFCCGLLIDPIKSTERDSFKQSTRQPKWQRALATFRDRRRTRGWRDAH